ncbi:orotate phosphoribosyltransferase [Pacificibacter sp. 1_MG-2023]|nr:orotate phosphoribosyltransferase [Pacificibacter sp. 1_MG-2023]
MKEPLSMSLTAQTRQQIAQITALALLDMHAVEVAKDRPFILSSGVASPVYIDVRKVISFPAVREKLMGFATDVIDANVGRDQIDAIAGAETAGIPFAAWIAFETGLPMQYVRKRAQGFGPQAHIEGVWEPGQRVLLVEDLTTDGASKLRFCQALRAAGLVVEDVFMLFQYDIFAETGAAMKRAGIRLHALCTWADILDVAVTHNRFTKQERDTIAAFLTDPLGWSADHGGARSLTF